MMVLVGGIELIHLTGEKALTMMSISPAVLSFQPAAPGAAGRAAQLQPAKLSSHCLSSQPGTNQPTIVQGTNTNLSFRDFDFVDVFPYRNQPKVLRNEK